MPFCLSFQAAYACRHSGACCRAGWPIPFEPEEAARVESLRLVKASSFERPDGPDAAAFATKQSDGRCIFFEPDQRLCAIHRTAGEAALPVTCRMFPRVLLKDARGTFVSLSHYCPTAAALLLEGHEPATVVAAPASLMPAGVLEGLDASDAWPPLLRPGVLMDHAGYAVWERHAIGVLARPGVRPWQALDAIESATAALTAWSPGPIALSDAVSRSFENASGDAASREPDGVLVALVRRAVPPELRRDALAGYASVPLDVDFATQYARAINRWLAARLFGTWIAYQANGLRPIVRYLRACLSVLLLELSRDSDGSPDERRFIDAVRRSDHLIVHLADSQRLATLLSRGFGFGIRDSGLAIRD